MLTIKTYGPMIFALDKIGKGYATPHDVMDLLADTGLNMDGQF